MLDGSQKQINQRKIRTSSSSGRIRAPVYNFSNVYSKPFHTKIHHYQLRNKSRKTSSDASGFLSGRWNSSRDRVVSTRRNTRTWPSWRRWIRRFGEHEHHGKSFNVSSLLWDVCREWTSFEKEVESRSDLAKRVSLKEANADRTVSFLEQEEQL